MSKYNNNIPTQNNRDRDYLKELIGIKKEIDKIYKQLSKDETFTDILDTIKTDFINENITIIEDNLSNPNQTNYKDFNAKIIKILNIFIKILEKFILEVDDNKYKTNIKNELDKTKLEVKNKINEEITTVGGDLENQKLNKIITLYFDENKTEKNNIYKKICIFEYYLRTFTNNNPYEESRNTLIKEKENELKNKDKSENEMRTLKEDIKKLHDDNKQIYRDLISFIKLESLEIIEDVLKKSEDKKKGDDGTKKNNNSDYINFIDKFKKEIYYETININNTQVNDDYAKLKNNSNERIDLESRKKLLGEMKELLDKQLSKLNDVIKYLRDSNKQEYSKEIIDIRKYFKDYTKEKDYKDSILSLIVNEETEVGRFLAKNIENRKNLEELKNNKNRDRERDRERNRGRGNGYGNGYGYESGGKFFGGDKKSSKYYEEKYEDIKKLNISIDNLIKSIQTNEGIDDVEDPFEKKNMAQFDASGKTITSIYKNIWNDYIKETQRNKAKGASIDTLKQENRLYERFKDNELDPSDVLKISFEDKAIFVCIILIIRTFSMVLIEFLIDYNVIGTIFRGIIVYSVIYILLIILSVLIINYDSYKLRIIVNYLNLHINSSNIFLHVIMFCLLIGLILIIINNNDVDNLDMDYILSYTYVYKYIYEIAEKSKYIYENPEKITVPTSTSLLISEKEKMKLRYRLDIITMLIFIFSSLLILVM